MNAAAEDVLVEETLAWAFSGKRRMSARHHGQVKGAIAESKKENRESAGKRRSRFWKLGPVWARRSA